MFKESSNPREIWMLDPTDVGAVPWKKSSVNNIPRGRWSYDPVWSGTELYVPGAAYDPRTDEWRPVDAPPLGKDRQREGLTSAWTDGSLLLFGGEEYACPDNGICDHTPGFDTLAGWTLANP